MCDYAELGFRIPRKSCVCNRLPSSEVIAPVRPRRLHGCRLQIAAGGKTVCSGGSAFPQPIYTGRSFWRQRGRLIRPLFCLPKASFPRNGIVMRWRVVAASHQMSVWKRLSLPGWLAGYLQGAGSRRGRPCRCAQKASQRRSMSRRFPLMGSTMSRGRLGRGAQAWRCFGGRT